MRKTSVAFNDRLVGLRRQFAFRVWDWSQFLQLLQKNQVAVECLIQKSFVPQNVRRKALKRERDGDGRGLIQVGVRQRPSPVCPRVG